jgi:hypothetical protein
MLPRELITYIFLFQTKWKFFQQKNKIVHLDELRDIMERYYYRTMSCNAFCYKALRIHKNKYYILYKNLTKDAEVEVAMTNNYIW